jgi:YgiT-type zinc finger domain-containing protein
MVDDTTSDITDLKTCIIIVRNVPCHKCTQCGEVAYDFNVGERLEQIVDSYRDSLTEITVVKYSNTAA